MKRYYYNKSIEEFIAEDSSSIFGELSSDYNFSVEPTQKSSWQFQVKLLKEQLIDFCGEIFFEYSIPRMGKRIDSVIIIQDIIFVLEFKVGDSTFKNSSIDQVWDYALDLKNFHKPSHNAAIVPILVASGANYNYPILSPTSHDDRLLRPVLSNGTDLSNIFLEAIKFFNCEKSKIEEWADGLYSPTPTIIEAAISMYRNHSVSEITRNDASALNLNTTTNEIIDIINRSKKDKSKSIIFVTGVPGAGKTLVGLNVATQSLNKENEISAVYLSGNGPLVSILREALTRNKIAAEKQKSLKVKKGEVMSEVKLFIQNVHHFRDDCLVNETQAPHEHVAIFDEAQRAWDLTQTANFMVRKKGKPNFNLSEPEFLISCLNRHSDWATVVCLVGGGQEINTGEAGIAEWLNSLQRSFNNWNIYISPHLDDSEYLNGYSIQNEFNSLKINYNKNLHLSVSMRSYRAENVSLLIKQILDLNFREASKTYKILKYKYPIYLTRNLEAAKAWLREKARGTERYGLIVSSQAQRLKPYAIDVKSPMDPVHWFLDDKEDVRSSYYLEDVATEFHVQGLELDWSCVTWDADFRIQNGEWSYNSFVGSKWQKINKSERKNYLKNAYRVLLTRARQGMIIVVPEGDQNDPTRNPHFYNETFAYLKEIGLEIIETK